MGQRCSKRRRNSKKSSALIVPINLRKNILHDRTKIKENNLDKNPFIVDEEKILIKIYHSYAS